MSVSAAILTACLSLDNPHLDTFRDFYLSTKDLLTIADIEICPLEDEACRKQTIVDLDRSNAAHQRIYIVPDVVRDTLPKGATSHSARSGEPQTCVSINFQTKKSNGTWLNQKLRVQFRPDLLSVKDVRGPKNFFAKHCPKKSIANIPSQAMSDDIISLKGINADHIQGVADFAGDLAQFRGKYGPIVQNFLRLAEKITNIKSKNA